MKMKNKNKMRFLAIVLAILMVLAMTAPIVAHATEYGNAWVYDEVGVVSDETEAYIANLNENVFANYKEKPQLAFIIIDRLPYNIDSYKLDMFNEYGVGTKEENHGMLFVFAISDREYALEIGDGFEKGSTLRKDLETDFITEDMKNSLRSENYDAVVLQVTQYLEKLMLDEENGVYAIKDAEAAEAKAAADAQAREVAKWALIVLVALIALGGLGVGVYHLVMVVLRKNAINNSIVKYANQIAQFGTKEQQDAVVREMRNNFAHSDPKFIKNYFGSTLFKKYRVYVIHRFAREGRDELYHQYCNKWESLASRAQMEICDIPSVEYVISEVNEAEDKMLANAAKNKQIVDKFFAENKNRIENKSIVSAIDSRLDVLRSARARIISVDEVEASFTKFIKEESFDYEVKRFMAENRELVEDNDFSEREFREMLRKHANYGTYRYTPHYNNAWMHNLLILHIANRARIRRDNEKRAAEQRAAEEKRRQERARRQAQQQRSNNTSFGTGFRGGFSTGGGFRGGW